jgi:hypothetical protein
MIIKEWLQTCREREALTNPLRHAGSALIPLETYYLLYQDSSPRDHEGAAVQLA